MKTEIRGVLRKADELVKIPRFNERIVRNDKGEAVVYVCEMVLAGASGDAELVVVDYGITLPDERGSGMAVPPLTVTLRMSAEAFLRVLREEVKLLLPLPISYFFIDRGVGDAVTRLLTGEGWKSRTSRCKSTTKSLRSAETG